MTIDFGTEVGDEIYAAQAPLADDDASYGFALLAYSRALGAMFEEVNWYAGETDTEPGWSRLANIDTAPPKALGWLAQFVGVRLDPALDDAAQRARIRATDGFKRGTVGAIAAAAQQYLTGAKTVLIRERDGDPYALTVVTYTAETPDEDAVRAALLAQKPAGIILTYVVEAGQDWLTLETGYATWNDVLAHFFTWQDVLNNTPH